MADARLAEMISKMAHELRSPLTSIKGFSSMLVSKWDRFDDAQRFEFVETIHHDAERMARVVTEVLDLARMEAGRLELNRTYVGVAETAAAAAGALGHLEGASRILVEAPDDLVVFADGERLANILSNLLENAVKFSDAGKVSVTARRENGDVEIAVTDEGVGIEKDHLETLFDGPSAARRGPGVPSGTGLGLYLARGLALLHGGSIEVDSTPGRGSCFTVRLPQGEDRDG